MRLRSIFALAAICFSVTWVGTAMAFDRLDRTSGMQAAYHEYQLPSLDFDIAALEARIAVTAEERTTASLVTPDAKTFEKINRLALASNADWTPAVVRPSERRAV